MQGVLAGRYRLERQLGKGGMGSVWLAEHLALRSWVAVKLMDPAIAATPEGAERFRREAQAAATLRSAHVVQVLDFGVHETTPYLVMELLHGESLAGCLEREKRLTPEHTVHVLTQVARALGRAHAAGIVHRDLKPDNIFLVREDDQELVKILDFGIAKTPQSQFGGMETRTGVTMGTPYYMSPEQAEGKRAVDFRTDLWAMAVIASECMTGARPFDGSTFGELLLNICARPIPLPSSQGLTLPGLDAWFAKATNRDAEQRFASAQELVNGLRDVVAGTASPQAFATPNTAPGVVPTSMMTAPGAAVTATSSNSSQSFEPRAARGGSALPWILLGLAVVVAAVTTTVLLMRSSPSSAAAEASASAATVAGPAPTQLVVAPPPEASTAAAPTPAPNVKHSVTDAAKGPTGDGAHPATPAVTSTAPTATSPTPAGAPNPPAGSIANAGKGAASMTCFSDPFSGQIRPVGPARPANAAPFACKQDPFTGKYKKL
jgi:eukaryotic-like serine/threonine-protein kinase